MAFSESAKAYRGTGVKGWNVSISRFRASSGVCVLVVLFIRYSVRGVPV